MAVRVLIALLWLAALEALYAAIKLPAAIDIYIHDVYVAVTKRSLIILILLAFVFPLLFVTVRRFRANPPLAPFTRILRYIREGEAS